MTISKRVAIGVATMGGIIALGGCDGDPSGEITLRFQAPADDGTLYQADGTVVDGELETQLCVTSSEDNITLTITIDGTEVATDSSLCTVPTRLSEGAHTVVAEAVSQSPAADGRAELSLEVDISAEAPTNFTAAVLNRQAITTIWDGVEGSSYELRYSEEAFSSDFQAFLVQGEAAPNAITGTSVELFPLDPGKSYYLGLVAVDADGNRSEVQTAGPLELDFTATGASAPVDPGQNPVWVLDDGGINSPARFGTRLVSGDFNGDTYGDVAVSAPGNNNFLGEVYIFYGSPGGLATPGGTDITPDVILRSGAAALFGRGLARLDWSGEGDGLAVSSPISQQVFIFHNAGLSVGTLEGGAPVVLSEDDRDVLIEVSGTTNYFTNSSLGLTLSSGQLDADGTPEDLIISAPLGGTEVGTRNPAGAGGRGGVVVLYGAELPKVGDTITLSQTAQSVDLLGLSGHIFENPVVGTNDTSDFAWEVNYLGDCRTGGGPGDFAVSYRADAQPPIISDNSVHVFRGRTDATPGMSFSAFDSATDLQILNPTVDNLNSFGNSVSSISDQDGDGFRDITIGAFKDSEVMNNTQDEGRIYMVSGSEVGTLTLNGPSDYLTKIRGTGVGRLGTGLANNAQSNNPDINGDGVEDLVSSSSTGLHAWYGGRIPAGDIDVDSADYSRPLATGMLNTFSVSEPPKIPVTWIDDLNGDGLGDLVWADWFPENGDERGIMEVLFE